jgi:uncharacterized protein (TIGR02145 family)
MTTFNHQAVRLGVIALLSVTSIFGLFAQTNVTLDPACQSCPPSATLNGNGTTPVPTPVASCGTAAGTYTVGTPLTAANTITFNLNVVTVGAYSITTTATNGMTFTGSGTFAGTGTRSVTLTGSGTPTTAGSNGILILYGGSACSVQITVSGGTPTLRIATGSGSFTGNTCFDIALGNNNANGCSTLANRTANQSNFTLPATHTQTYIFTPSGTVSNVRFSYVNVVGAPIIAISGNNTGNNISTAVNATVNYSTTLNTTATGLTNSNPLKAEIYVTYNDGATNNGTDKTIKLTPKVKDCMCCFAKAWRDGVNGYLPLVTLNFACHNLGADASLDPMTSSAGTVGDLYQWGRRTDGHEKRTSATTTLSATNSMGTLPAGFVGKFAVSANWLSGNSVLNLWGGGNPAYVMNQPKSFNDPCPEGYKVPSTAQISGMLVGNNAGNQSGYTTANTYTQTAQGLQIGTALFLPAGGQRNYDGTIYPSANGNHYWCSDWSIYARENYFIPNSLIFVSSNSTINISSNDYTNLGASVRCIEE